MSLQLLASQLAWFQVLITRILHCGLQKYVIDRLLEDDGATGDQYGPYDAEHVKEERDRIKRQKVRLRHVLGYVEQYVFNSVQSNLANIHRPYAKVLFSGTCKGDQGS